MRKLKTLHTITELAAFVDRSRQAVHEWVKRGDWPFPKRGPFTPTMQPEILRWMAENLRQNELEKSVASGEMAELRRTKIRAEIRKLNAQADAAETELGRTRGKLMDAAEVEREWASVGAIVRNGFQTLSSQIVPLALNRGLPNEAAPGLQQEIDEAVNGILKTLSSDSAQEAA